MSETNSVKPFRLIGHGKNLILMLESENLASVLKIDGLVSLKKGINPKKAKNIKISTLPFMIGFYGLLYILKHNIAGLRDQLLSNKKLSVFQTKEYKKWANSGQKSGHEI